MVGNIKDRKLISKLDKLRLHIFDHQEVLVSGLPLLIESFIAGCRKFCRKFYHAIKGVNKVNETRKTKDMDSSHAMRNLGTSSEKRSQKFFGCYYS